MLPIFLSALSYTSMPVSLVARQPERMDWVVSVVRVTLAVLPATGWPGVVPGMVVWAATKGTSTGAASRPATVMVFITSRMRMLGNPFPGGGPGEVPGGGMG